MPFSSHCIPRLIAFYFKSSNAKLIPFHALSLPFITGISCNWPPSLLVTKRVEEWVLNAPIKQSQSMLGSFGWTKNNDDSWNYNLTLKMPILSSQTIQMQLLLCNRILDSGLYLFHYQQLIFTSGIFIFSFYPIF